MASNTTPVKLRLALRREGDFWNAYVAIENTMEGAFFNRLDRHEFSIYSEV